jgi:hypothetical protein
MVLTSMVAGAFGTLADHQEALCCYSSLLAAKHVMTPADALSV